MLQLLYGYIQHGLLYTNWQNIVHICMCLCSLLSPTTFEGAHGNLVRLLERSRRRYHELNDQPTSQKGLSLEQQMYATNVHLLLFKN